MYFTYRRINVKHSRKGTILSTLFLLNQGTNARTGTNHGRAFSVMVELSDQYGTLIDLRNQESVSGVSNSNFRDSCFCSTPTEVNPDA